MKFDMLTLQSTLTTQYTDVDRLAYQYQMTITAILDMILPLQTSTHRERPPDPWFDGATVTKQSAVSSQTRTPQTSLG